MFKNVFWHKKILGIGGIETFLYAIATKYKDRDITIYYQSGDVRQIERLSKLVRLVRWHGEDIQCERLFLNFNADIIDHVTADEYIQILHADWSAVNLPYKISPKVTKVIAVSKATADPFRKATGREVADIVYLPQLKQTPRKVLHLISATRLSREKGWNRMVKLADALDKADIPYQWTVFTESNVSDKRFCFLKSRLNVADYIADADYLVQLSDTEGFCYTVNESLMLGTPVIVTPCPAFDEIGVINGENGFVLPFDMGTIPTMEIYKGLPPFEFKPKADKWGKYLLKGKSDYNPADVQYRVICVHPYYDLYFNRQIKRGEVLTVPMDRYETLMRTAYVRGF